MQAQQAMDQFTQDRLYVGRHRDELLQQYPDQWVAVYNQQVVGAAKDPEQVVKQLEHRGIPPGQAYCEWLSTRDDLLILLSPTR
jgi:hypothetical protein